MSYNNPVKFGTKAFAVIDACWNSGQQSCEITFEDDNGIRYQTTAMGASNQEIRQAVFDAVKDAWVNARANEIGDTAERFDSVSKQLAIACGNHPYEDGE